MTARPPPQVSPVRKQKNNVPLHKPMVRQLKLLKRARDNL